MVIKQQQRVNIIHTFSVVLLNSIVNADKK